VYALWLQDPNGNGYLALVEKPLAQPKLGEMGVGELDENGIPKSIEGYQRLNAILAATDKNLTEIKFGEEGKTIQIRSPKEAAELVPLYVYDEKADTMTNQETGVVYQNLRGAFTAPSGDQIRPGFVAPIRFDIRQFQGLFCQPCPAWSPGTDYPLEFRLCLPEFVLELFTGVGHCHYVQ
jgi:arabinogalactan oligomer/maltooligosaccharide transport system permease protein